MTPTTTVNPNDSLRFEFQNNRRATERYVGSIGEETALEWAIHATAYSSSKQRPGNGYYDDHLYLAVTAKDGRHTIGYISDTLPSHGVAFMHPNRGSALVTSVVPESELAAAQPHLSKDFDMYKVSNEKGEFLTYAMVRKGEEFTPERVYDAITAAMRQPAGRGQTCLGIMNSLLHIEGIDPEVLTGVLRKIGGINEITDSPPVAANLAAQFVKNDVPIDRVAELIYTSKVDNNGVADLLTRAIDGSPNGHANGMPIDQARELVRRLVTE